MATVKTFPTSDNSAGSWTNSDSGTTNLYSYVDEETLSTLDYITSSIVENGSDAVLFNFGNPTIPEGSTIDKIVVKINRTNSQEVITRERVRLLINSTNYDYNETADSGNNYYVELAENPDTSSGWTVSDIDNLVSGYYHTTASSKGNVANIYQYYIEVYYTEGVTPTVGLKYPLPAFAVS